MTYNRIRYLELFKRSQDLKNQGKSLYRENQEEYLELCGYEVAIENHVFWKNSRQFALLMVKNSVMISLRYVVSP